MITHEQILTVLNADYPPDPGGLGTWSVRGTELDWTHRTDPEPSVADLETALPAVQANQQAAATAAALVELRMIRDRWLAQTDYVEVFLSGGFSPLPTAIQNEITANKAGWLGWRQALRDLPASAGLDPVAAVTAAATVHSTADTFPAPWPQPPAAPVIHLT